MEEGRWERERGRRERERGRPTTTTRWGITVPMAGGRRRMCAGITTTSDGLVKAKLVMVGSQCTYLTLTLTSIHFLTRAL